MFYFRRYINNFLRPFFKPMDQKTALKYHFGAVFFYILFASNLLAYGYYSRDQLEDENIYVEKDKVLQKAKEKIEFYHLEPNKIITFGNSGIKSVDFDIKDYLAEKERLNEEKFKKEKLKSCI